jgi:hypothetical protein
MIIKNVKDMVSGLMSEKESEHLLKGLFSEKLEQDSWFNNYQKPIKNFK